MGRKTKTYKKHQKIYKMKGCSKKTRKNYLGGNNISSGDVNLAYPSTNVPSVPNPFLAYTGKGGACNDSLTPSLNIPVNVGGVNKTVPNTGPLQNTGLGTNFLNPLGSQHGGCCGGTLFGGSKKGRKGGCGPMCMAPLLMLGGKKMLGGKIQAGGNPGIPYPDGRVGGAWSASPSHWPGVDGVQGGRNYLPLNTYNNDISRQMINVGAQPPFLGGGRRSRKHSRKQKGGALSNFMGQDLINLGRQFQFGIGSAYNAVAGYAAPVNPLPWKGQLPNTSNINTVRTASM
jgi:hypothetical protein